jgi:hypothetical protein
LGVCRERLVAFSCKRRGFCPSIDDPNHRERFLDNVPENRETLELAQQWVD